MWRSDIPTPLSLSRCGSDKCPNRLRQCAVPFELQRECFGLHHARADGSQPSSSRQVFCDDVRRGFLLRFVDIFKQCLILRWRSNRRVCRLQPGSREATLTVRNVTVCVFIALMMCDRNALAVSWGRVLYIRLMMGLGAGWDMGVWCVGLPRSRATFQEIEGGKQ